MATTVINVGKKTFFQRNDRWEDSVLTEEQTPERQADRTVQRRVLRAEPSSTARKSAKYLALEGKVVIVLGDQAYEF